MQSLTSRLLYRVVKYQITKLNRRNLSLVELRVAREATAQKLLKMPPAIAIEATTVGGCKAEWLRPATPAGDGIVLYVHGGAYTNGSCITHRGLAARLAAASGHAALIFEYSLAPEHPFPAALDDALRVYEAVRSANPNKPIALAGDSAGAGLALAMSIKLKQAGLPLPTALALMSPWTDLAMTSKTHHTKADVDPFFPSPDRLAGAAKQYAGNEALDHPLISPHYAELTGLPPLLIHVGDRETLLNDSLWLAERAHSQGTSVKVKVWPAMWHVWQAFGGKMREADESVSELGAFLRQHLLPH